MNTLRQLLIILALYMAGQVIQAILNIPIPGNIIGMLLLLIGLYTKMIKLEMVEKVASFFLKNLAFFFVPAGVALITTVDILKESWHKIFVIAIVSTFVVLFVTSKSIEIIKKLQKR